MEYLIIEIALIVFTILVHKSSKVKIFNSHKQFVSFWFFIFLFGVTLAYYAIVRGHRIYTDKFLIELSFLGIPLEDYFFMVVVPYIILVAYQISFRRFKKK